jgi:hypothetical protein
VIPDHLWKPVPPAPVVEVNPPPVPKADPPVPVVNEKPDQSPKPQFAPVAKAAINFGLKLFTPPKGRAKYERPLPLPRIPFRVDPNLEDATGKVFLSDLQEFATTAGPQGWSFAKNGNRGDNNPRSAIKVNGVAYPKSLGMHPPWRDCMRTCYALGKQAKTFSGAVALNDDDTFGSPSTRFVVFGDDKLLWRSPSISNRNHTETFTVDVSEVDVLELRTYTETGLVTGALAVWLDPFVVKK